MLCFKTPVLMMDSFLFAGAQVLLEVAEAAGVAGEEV